MNMASEAAQNAYSSPADLFGEETSAQADLPLLKDLVPADTETGVDDQPVWGKSAQFTPDIDTGALKGEEKEGESTESKKQLESKESEVSVDNPYASPDDLLGSSSSALDDAPSSASSNPYAGPEELLAGGSTAYSSPEDLVSFDSNSKINPAAATASSYATPEDLLESASSTSTSSASSTSSESLNPYSGAEAFASSVGTSAHPSAPPSASSNPYAGPEELMTPAPAPAPAPVPASAARATQGKATNKETAQAAVVAALVGTSAAAGEITPESAIAENAAALAALPPPRNWQAEFIALMTEAPTTSDAAALKYQKLFHLVRDFSEVARVVGKVIASEAGMPVQNKTVKPADVGGIAGGQKFFSQNIFFKRVMDDMNLYGGLEGAAKAAGHELKGLRAFIEYRLREDEKALTNAAASGAEAKNEALDNAAKAVGVSKEVLEDKLYTGLMIVLDTRGIRILATSLLPLSKGSLQYGSANAGDTVFKHPRCHALMEHAGKAINLKEHVVGNSPEAQRSIYGPCDIEVHIGTDDRVYVLDTARVFPPSPPPRFHNAVAIPPTGPILGVQLKASDWQNEVGIYLRNMPIKTLRDNSTVICYADPAAVAAQGRTLKENVRASVFARRKLNGTVIVVNVQRGSHLYCMLRPELVKNSKVPLSSDAFSFFGTHESKVHNAEVRTAFNHLMDEVIPTFAKELANKAVVVNSESDLAREMHARGINMRYLSRVRQFLPSSDRGRAMIMTSMVSRVCKAILRKRLREVDAQYAKKGWTGPIPDAAYREAVLVFFNTVFGGSQFSGYFWQLDVYVALFLKYGLVFDSTDIAVFASSAMSTDIRPFTNVSALFVSLQEQTGVRFTTEITRAMMLEPLNYYMKARPFKPSDLVCIDVLSDPVYFNTNDILRKLEEQIEKDASKELSQASVSGPVVPGAERGAYADLMQQAAHTPAVDRLKIMQQMSLENFTREMQLSRHFHKLSQQVFSEKDIHSAASYMRSARAFLDAGGGSAESIAMGVPRSQGLIEEALKSFQEGWRYLRNSPEVVVGEPRIACHFLHAEILEALGRLDEAMNQYVLATRHLDGYFGTAADVSTSKRDMTYKASTNAPGVGMQEFPMSTPRGHPFAWILAERIAQLLQKMAGNSGTASLHNLTARVSTLHSAFRLPEDSFLLKRLLGTTAPLTPSLLYYAHHNAYFLTDENGNPISEERRQQMHAAYDAAFASSVENMFHPDRMLRGLPSRSQTGRLDVDEEEQRRLDREAAFRAQAQKAERVAITPETHPYLGRLCSFVGESSSLACPWASFPVGTYILKQNKMKTINTAFSHISETVTKTRSVHMGMEDGKCAIGDENDSNGFITRFTQKVDAPEPLTTTIRKGAASFTGKAEIRQLAMPWDSTLQHNYFTVVDESGVGGTSPADDNGKEKEKEKEKNERTVGVLCGEFKGAWISNAMMLQTGTHWIPLDPTTVPKPLGTADPAQGFGTCEALDWVLLPIDSDLTLITQPGLPDGSPMKARMLMVKSTTEFDVPMQIAVALKDPTLITDPASHKADPVTAAKAGFVPAPPTTVTIKGFKTHLSMKNSGRSPNALPITSQFIA